MTDSEAERAAIRAAMTRLLDGTPQRSTGALSVLQLAAEADVKRWVLTHKHIDLADEFRCRARALGPIPVAFSHLEHQAKDAQQTIAELRADNRKLRQQVSVYARIIHELTARDAPPTSVIGAHLSTSTVSVEPGGQGNRVRCPAPRTRSDPPEGD
ncbi:MULTISPECIES: hypothetical protein [Mycobacterium]|jgi:hypothetical protein|uniref:Uncharacterized protein n=2 Tax=Mycobacterium TaxID=1763 RepID=A0A1Y0C3T6_9MYCO|nr:MULTISPECIES: hypothetical protein [Mycobacterium]ART69860.1 hypothetical protein BTO20_15840 [Mycobacterium dioxanotrophicus]ORA29903.1 hypothetical protein BST13_26575 [Mycobacterium aquaticum]